MKIIRLIALAAAMAAPILSARAAAPRAPSVAREEADPADSLFRSARQALNDEDFRRASRLFQQITDKYPRSTHSAEALYFRAFALYRLGGEPDLRDALALLETHKDKYPKAATAGDADQLAVRIEGALAKRGDAESAGRIAERAGKDQGCSTDKDDMRMAAMDAMLQMNYENVLPIIKQILARRDACSVPMRKKAMFLLSQKPGSESESLIIDAIKSDPSDAVREDAIFWLGQTHSSRAASTLEDLALNASDSRVRDKAIFSLSQQNSARALGIMRRIAESDDSPRQLRKSAIFQIGQHGSGDNAQYLKDLFTKLPKSQEELKKDALFSLSQMRGFGNDRFLVSVATDESQTVEVRKHAIFCAGQNGVSGRELAGLYDKVTDREVKKQLIWVMSDSRDNNVIDRLIEIAKNDKDPEMRKQSLFWLGQKNDPRIRQLILDILKD